MTRKPKHEPTHATHLSNSAVRREMIQKAAVQLRHLNQDIEGHKVHIKAIREDLKEIFDRLKNDLGLDRKFIEFTIKNLIEPEEVVRDAIQDTMREIYEALQPGQQLDWLNADAKINQPHESPQPTVTTDRPDFPA